MAVLPEAGDEEHFQIMREWLTDCDAHGCMVSRTYGYRPRRLVYLDDADEYLRCRLVFTSGMPNGAADVQYIALSHPWGHGVESEPFKATESTMTRLVEGMNTEDLPRTLRDAVVVVHGLGHHFIWIDSLCIRQASEHDEGEFMDEAQHMQAIYSSAYCVIAASSATDMRSGLLYPRKQESIKWLAREATKATSEYHISSILDDFESDVERAPLSGRGWVFQERALARRTIFFTKNQTYFECGHGIRCETLTKLRRCVWRTPVRHCFEAIARLIMEK
jgi:hypothetical protein